MRMRMRQPAVDKEESLSFFSLSMDPDTYTAKSLLQFKTLILKGHNKKPT